MQRQSDLREQFRREASFTQEPILVRGPDEKGLYRVVDGMHRFVGVVLDDRETVRAFVPTNAIDHLPICEPHVVYDLIRGFIRHAHDPQGMIELEHALRLLARTYANVIPLLTERFTLAYVPDDDVQKVISKVLSRDNQRTKGGDRG
jgi:hypothetical protein